MPHDHLRVLAHPLRMRILSLLTGTAMSAAEAARELGETQANTSYHFRRLHDAGLLEVAEEVRIRGGRAKRYRHDPESGKRLTSRDPGEERLLTKAVATELLRRADSRAGRRPASLTDAELWVAPEVWARLLKQATELSRELHDAAQPPRTPGTVRVSASVALFELTAGSAEPR
ncbi:DNA-binding transcriptional ArsR family regulator [Amycolatopsis lexingtonensis]|uniref:DNA-binding transcriptional ArsR family regulator n=1 Tax=Amycolatopsis lexingtonensis TaxID=218822 RepID=A0ABR9IDI1_9PSEU|nr:helix-turn-helix domain-containing protein [Amycolatopsis lexingtonensis]MBE1501241.1 DNA-binding transcriptional ArsR family regulator [Amycolatopsis lexingtonensis]